MDGILVVNKEVNMTSFDVVARVRKLTSTKKVGHAGTLDPDASGVLPVCTGRATKIIEFLMNKDKAYRVELILGKATDTQDASGNTLYERPVEASLEEIEKTIYSFIGEKKQIPPMYSAIKINGQKLYDLARKGIEVEREPRTVFFHKIEIKEIERLNDKVRVLMDVECSKGTYMRTLCHDIGESLGCGGHMASLVRTRSGPFLLKEAYTLAELEELKNKGSLKTAFKRIDEALLHFPPVYVSASDAKKLRNGMAIKCAGLTPGLYRIYDENDSFLAIGKILENGDTLKSYKWIEPDNLGKDE
ncbi:MAG: tRNA pseudouridine(55) synthase TruB [Clostridiaceae bacterium]|nr:tRNA pseudouridine(55) synthase TruB [Clostridiaceae bacterium]